MRGGHGDRGVASVWTAFAACALCVVFGAVLALGQAVAARHRAGGAADLAALAAADRALRGEAEACAVAGRVAAAQGAELVRCGVTGAEAEVTARVVRGPWAPTVRARAGPAPVGPLPTALPGAGPSPVGQPGPVPPPVGPPGAGPPGAGLPPVGSLPGGPP
ncbi:Rv3654c family TadE-like protein [Streptomyces sp. NPDC056503]|uniref:Rv3654c family TadE-like protein n=1 Tax=Streptomyces sp. NPDC056503 TaxID=3345842 RepID=UPI0036C3BDDD